MREAATRALGNIGSAATQHLEDLLRSNDREVMLAAAAALIAIHALASQPRIERREPICTDDPAHATTTLFASVTDIVPPLTYPQVVIDYATAARRWRGLEILAGGARDQFEASVLADLRFLRDAPGFKSFQIQLFRFGDGSVMTSQVLCFGTDPNTGNDHAVAFRLWRAGSNFHRAGFPDWHR